MSSITSSPRKNSYRPNVIKRSPIKKQKKNEKESTVSLNNIKLELENDSPNEIKRSNTAELKKKIEEEKNDLKKENEKEENKNENIKDKNNNTQNGKVKKKKVIDSPKRRPGRKYVKINENVEIIPVENWKQYNCDMSEGTQRHTICKCCNIL